jgi:proteasome lid subunit RPN8/RPN11
MDSGSRVTATISAGACHALVESCGASNMHGREVGGILVGHCRQISRAGSQHDYKLSITDVIPVASLDSSSDHISFGEQAWNRAEHEIKRQYAGKLKLGWYHTHPTQGIFFSTQDHKAHGVFDQAYHCALVVDPISMEAGLFYWRDRGSRIVAGPICFPLISARS